MIATDDETAYEALIAYDAVIATDDEAAYEAVPVKFPVIPLITFNEPLIFTSPLYAILTNSVGVIPFL